MNQGQILLIARGSSRPRCMYIVHMYSVRILVGRKQCALCTYIVIYLLLKPKHAHHRLIQSNGLSAHNTIVRTRLHAYI